MKKLIFIIAAIVTIVAHADLLSKPKFAWTPPNEWVDGTPLDPATDLSGYKIYCNQDSIVIDVNGGNTTEYQASAGQFPQGDNECEMTAVSTLGIESERSEKKSFRLANQPKTVTFTIQ